jgi:outer membrane putative beta-barrel porin/alpha-amylase
MTRPALVLVLLLLPRVAGAGESPEPISPDRAGASASADTVGRGVVQVESGIAYLRESVGVEPTERRLRVEAAIRAGVTERFELRLEGLPLVRLRGAEDETGLGEIFVTAKYRFLDAAGDAWRPALGVLPFVKLPVSEPPLGSGKTDVGAILLASFVLPGQVSLDLNAGLAAVGQSRPSGSLMQALAAVGTSRDVADWLTLFTDLLYASRDERGGRDSLLLDLGAIWRPTPSIALDASALTSLAGRGPDWAVRAGVSVRFGP